MNPSLEPGAGEVLASLSSGTILLVCMALTGLRLFLLAATARAAHPGQRPVTPKWARGIADILASLLLAGVLVFFIIRPFFVQAFYIPSESMEGTLLVHDHIFVNKCVYRFHTPCRGDIVVFRAPKEADREDLFANRPVYETILVKRLIGLPGDTIEVRDGAVYRTLPGGKPERLEEPYIRDAMNPVLESSFDYGAPCSFENTRPTCGPVFLGRGRLWVMGDNRNNSNDSRYWGPLEDNRVIGRAALIFWPLNRIRALR